MIVSLALSVVLFCGVFLLWNLGVEKYRKDHPLLPPSKQNTVSGDQNHSGQSTAKEIPDLRKAKQTLINSLNQFDSAFVEKLKDVSTVVQGYFELSADHIPSALYSYPTVNTKQIFSTHYYASIRLGAILR
jgi:hypothetical protein